MRTNNSPRSHKGKREISIIIVALLFSTATVYAQSFTDKIVKELTFEKPSPNNTLIIGNINGSVTVKGYEGNKIMVEVERTIKAKTNEKLELGKKEIQLGIKDLSDSLIVYTSERCNTFANKKSSGTGKRQWSYHSDCDHGNCDSPYSYTMTFLIKVPHGINVDVSTINGGDIYIESVSGIVKANNINGSIRLSSLKGATYAHTINGNVDLDYAGNPSEDCIFYTLNGEINASFKKGLAANLNFKSFNGELFTNVDKLESLPAIVEKEKYSNVVKYKVSNSRFKISNGGVNLDFETFNGDVIVKEQ
jgi:hypothetical protein